MALFFLSATLSISTAVQAVLLMILVRRKIGSLGIADLLQQGALKVVVAVVACAAAWGARKPMPCWMPLTSKWR